MTDDYIDDDRDVLVPAKDNVRPSIEAAVKAASDRAVEAAVSAKTAHLEATGFFRRTYEGVKSWGVELKARWGGGR